MIGLSSTVTEGAGGNAADGGGGEGATRPQRRHREWEAGLVVAADGEGQRPRGSVDVAGGVVAGPVPTPLNVVVGRRRQRGGGREAG